MSYGTDDTTGEHRFLVIGKAGNGKSSLCNALVGEAKFKVGRGMTTTTTTASYATAKSNKNIKVIDTPDITNCGLTEKGARQEEVARWRNQFFPGPTVVLLLISCAVRYTKEEHAIYREIAKHWAVVCPDSLLTDLLIVVFTFEDKLDVPLVQEVTESCRTCPELKSVLQDAGNIYISVNNKNDESRKGVMYKVFDAIEKRQVNKREAQSVLAPDRERQRVLAPTAPAKTAGGGGLLSPLRSSVPTWLLPLLIAIAVILAIFCVVFLILQNSAVAIGCGVPGLLLALVVGIVFCLRRNHRRMTAID